MIDEPPWRVELTRRRRCPEIMDRPDLAEADHIHALRGLERINFWSGSAHILWPVIRRAARLARDASSPPLRVLDVATGAGDVPLSLCRKARRAGLDLVVSGCDLSARAVAHARERAVRAGAQARFFVWDALAGPLLQDYDIVTCSLFLHHLGEEEAVSLLERMGRIAGRLVLVSDLERGALGYWLAYYGTRLLSSSTVVRTDGPRSVCSAFSRREALALAQKAGLAGATALPRWPCRFLLSWRRPPGRLPA